MAYGLRGKRRTFHEVAGQQPGKYSVLGQLTGLGSTYPACAGLPGWQLYQSQQMAQIGPLVEHVYTAGQNNGQIEYGSPARA